MTPQDAYDRGFVDALRAYAHWMDGEQYVGTCGMKLKDAIVNRAIYPSYDPPPPRSPSVPQLPPPKER